MHSALPKTILNRENMQKIGVLRTIMSTGAPMTSQYQLEPGCHTTTPEVMNSLFGNNIWLGQGTDLKASGECLFRQ